MMYYLLVGNAKKGITIDISKLKGFENSNPNRLNDIVAFTNSFASDIELATFLKNYGVIPKDYDNLTFGIYRKENKDDKLEKLRFGVSFKEDAKYFDVETLTEYILGNLADEKFFTAFVNRYYSIYEVKRDTLNSTDALHAMPSIYSRYIFYINNGRFLTETLDVVSDFIKKYAREYACLRDLAMFVIDYKRKLHNVKNNLEVIKELKEELLYIKSILRNEDLTDEQIIAYQEKIKNLENNIEMRYGR